MQPQNEPHLRPETQLVSTGRPARVPDAPLNQPIVPASTYLAGEPDGDLVGYGRYGNPGWVALEQAVGTLEGGRALAFGSGMAAAQAILDRVPLGGTLVLPRHCYLGVAAAARERAEQGRLQVRVVDVIETAEVVAACAGADLVWMESPTNPMMEVVDLRAVATATRDAGAPGALVVVDNTFATPLLQRPLDLGADVVLHSGTKLIGGHSDALSGLVVVHPNRADVITGIDATRRLHGGVPGSLETYLILRGLRTLSVRLERAQANAETLARELGSHPAITAVRYPGLESDPFRDRAAAQMDGFGSLLAVELTDAARADAFVAGLRLWVPATSLGGVESTLERRRRWAGELPTVPEGLVRMSVGIEHVEDLLADLRQSLDRV